MKNVLSENNTLLVVVAVLILALGILIGSNYTKSVIVNDCKVLGMTRFGNVPMGCRIGEKSND